uniref:Putative secreted protein n=1 Tax=Ixodes ricinus TaxID=34613 RepID=A0A6B0UHF3_IXORI
MPQQLLQPHIFLATVEAQQFLSLVVTCGHWHTCQVSRITREIPEFLPVCTVLLLIQKSPGKSHLPPLPVFPHLSQGFFAIATDSCNDSEAQLHLTSMSSEI